MGSGEVEVREVEAAVVGTTLLGALAGSLVVAGDGRFAKVPRTKFSKLPEKDGDCVVLGGDGVVVLDTELPFSGFSVDGDDDVSEEADDVSEGEEEAEFVLTIEESFAETPAVVDAMDVGPRLELGNLTSLSFPSGDLPVEPTIEEPKPLVVESDPLPGLCFFFRVSFKSQRLAGEGVIVVSVKLAVVNFPVKLPFDALAAVLGL